MAKSDKIILVLKNINSKLNVQCVFGALLTKLHMRIAHLAMKQCYHTTSVTM